MPAELPQIRRSRGKASGRFEQDTAKFESPALVTGGSGVHRQPRTALSGFRGAAASAAEDALAAIEEEREVLRLKALGLSLRVIGARLRLDKMKVSRILKRITDRGIDIGAEVEG
jgi:DNA-binding CsgD family transcriptional regulator